MWDVFNTPFKGFDPADFEAYTEEKWSSHLHTRARMGVRDKLTAIGRLVADQLKAGGANLSHEANDPRPSVFNNNSVDAQWIFFTRTDEDKKKLAAIIDRGHSVADNIHNAAHHKRGLMLGVKVHAGGVDVMLGLHAHAWVDVRNGLQKLDDPWERERLSALLKALVDTPAGQLHLVGPSAVVPAPEVDAAALRGQLGALSSGQGEWLIWGRNFPADDPEVQQERFGQVIAETFVALLPLYRFLLWTSDNDHLALKAEIAENKALSKRDGVTLEPGDQVFINAGLFNGQTGVVEDVDKKGMVKVSVGKLVIQVKGTTLRRL